MVMTAYIPWFLGAQTSPYYKYHCHEPYPSAEGLCLSPISSQFTPQGEL